MVRQVDVIDRRDRGHSVRQKKELIIGKDGESRDIHGGFNH